MASTSKSYICNGRLVSVEEDVVDDILFQSFSSIEDMTALSEKQNNRQSGEQAEDDVQHRMSRSTTSHRKRGRPRNQSANPTPDMNRAKLQNQANESDDFEATVAKLKEEVKVRSINEENVAKLLQQTQAEKKIETEKYRSLEKHSEELKQSLVQSNANLEKLLDQSNEKIETISKLCQDREHQIEKVETELKVAKEELLQTRVSKSDSDILALSNSLQDYETKIWRQQEIILKKIDETDQLKQDLVERNKTITTLAKRLEEEERKRAEGEKKKIRLVPPGLRVFPNRPYRYYTAKTLNLETDFPKYNKKRALLKSSFNMSDEKISAIFADPHDFVLRLSPETISALVLNEEDFKAVCDYLFYAQMATADVGVMEMYRKALIDLLRNLDFGSWNFRLQHILVVLENLGGNPDLFACIRHFEEAMKHRIQSIVSETSKTSETYRFTFAKLPEFFVTKKKNPPNSPPKDFETEAKNNKSPNSATSLEVKTKLEKNARLRSVKNLLSLASELMGNYPDLCKSLVAPSQESDQVNKDWINSLILCHILAILSCDQHLAIDYVAMNDITDIYGIIIKSFTTSQWNGVSADGNNSEMDESNSAFCDLAEVFYFVGHIFDEDSEEKYEKKMAEQRCWAKDELPIINKINRNDHHHNMVHRLRQIPPTLRGNQLRKTVGFMHLQQLIDPRKVDNVLNVDAEILWNFLRPRFDKEKLIFGNFYYLGFSILRLIDIVVGDEPLVEYKAENIIETLRALHNRLLNLTNCLFADTTAGNVFDIIKVKEFTSQMWSKWLVLNKESNDIKYREHPESADFSDSSESSCDFDDSMQL